MQNSFLTRVAEDIYRRKGDNISKCVFIFPNKRPEEYLQLAISGLINKPIAAPKVLSIEEFIYSHSNLKQADALQLVFMLYKVYVKYLPQEDFEKFYPWGNLLLKDYDEIDRYMAPADKLFAHLKAIKEIESAFATDISEVLQPDIQEDEPNYLQKRFLYLWEVYRAIYNDFQKYLQERKLAYPGMAYREVAEKCKLNRLNLNEFHYVFVGFNALSTAEETIIKACTENGRGSVYWDADEYYLVNEREEAGHFIREAVKKLPPPQGWNFDKRLSSEEKTIHIIGVPLKVGQAKALGVEVKKHFSGMPYMQNIENCAVVLPEENMLLPVMHALPHNELKVYSTSGYPLTNSSFYALLEHLFLLQENFVAAKQSFYYKDVLAVLRHPLIRCRNHKQTADIIANIEENELIYIELAELEKSFDCEVVKLIFQLTPDTEKLINYIYAIAENIRSETPGFNESERIMLTETLEIIKQLEQLLHTQDVHLHRNTFLRLFREAAAQRRIPMVADTQNALQVMGMLETRSLSFDTVFLMSVNEGVLPAGKRNHSFIPYELRKAYKLPTYDEQDALSAYYFYRLLQGANEVFLFYNSETGSRGEEKSRYVRQLEYYLTRANPNLKLKYRHYSLPLLTNTPKEIIIQKDENYYAQLQEKSNRNGLSPSLISSYFICSLQFLINYIIQLQAKEELSEDMDASALGTLFHAVMQKLYLPFKGKNVTQEDIQQLKNKVTDALEDVLLEEYKSQKEHMAERNSLLLETVKVLAEKALEQDAKYAPFRILHLEEKLQHTIEIQNGRSTKITLQGIIDRVDEKDGVTRIIDYKTGEVKRDIFNFSDAEEVITKDNKEAFQTLFYTYLYKSKYGATQLQPNILALKKVNEGYLQVNAKLGKLEETHFQQFEQKLKEIIYTILDAKQPIIQVEDRSICTYCNYTYFCLR